MTELSFKASDYVLLAARMRVTARYSGAADDLRLADKWEAEARTKQLPSTRTEVGAGGELIDIENRSHTFGTVDTVANPDYVTAEASHDRLALANQAGSLGLALDAANTIQAQDSLEKTLVHQMAVLHRGMMRATARMDEELDAAGVIDPNKREAANVRACRLAGAISRMSASYQQALLTLQRKRTGGSQHVTVKHIHQQVNVTEGGQAVVAGDKVTSRTRGRRASDGGGWSKMSNEPLAREGERMRARLEALIMANAAPRCGARSKRTGKPCRAAAMPNGRCKVHGGKSTGPRTPEGLERSKRARLKHGYYSREAKAER